MNPTNKQYLNKQKYEFVTYLQRLMRSSNISEAKLSRDTGIPQATLHKILTGKTADPRASTLTTLASYFNISINQLLQCKTSDDESKNINTNTQSIPVISWKECLNHKKLIPSLTSAKWDNWIVAEALSNQAYALMSKPSMSNKIPKNSTLIIEPGCTPKDGDLVVVRYPETDEATLRELSLDGPEKMLVSLKKDGKALPLSDKEELLGVVVQSRFSFI